MRYPSVLGDAEARHDVLRARTAVMPAPHASTDRSGSVGTDTPWTSRDPHSAHPNQWVWEAAELRAVTLTDP